MADIQGLLEEIRKHNERREEREKTPVGKLVNKLTDGRKKTDEEYLQLRQEVKDFIRTASEEEKKIISGYAEGLSMICSAIEIRKGTKKD